MRSDYQTSKLCVSPPHTHTLSISGNICIISLFALWLWINWPLHLPYDILTTHKQKNPRGENDIFMAKRLVLVKPKACCHAVTTVVIETWKHHQFLVNNGLSSSLAWTCSAFKRDVSDVWISSPDCVPEVTSSEMCACACVGRRGLLRSWAKFGALKGKFLMKNKIGLK